jgi:Arc/MetJ-type ribon-helix-helix transcriptional regulator
MKNTSHNSNLQIGQKFFSRPSVEEDGYVRVRVPGPLQGFIHTAIEARDYASIDDVMLEALHDWAQKRNRELRTLNALHERAAQAMRTISTGMLPPAQRDQLLQETRALLQRERTR